MLPCLLSIGDVPEEVIELEADRAYSGLISEARCIGLDDVALLKEQIKVWHKDTQAQQRTQQRKHATHNEAALAAESATCSVGFWQKVCVYDHFVAVYKTASLPPMGGIAHCSGSWESYRNAACHAKG